MRLSILGINLPTFFLFLALLLDNAFGVGTGRIYVGKCANELQGVRTIQPERDLRIWRFLHGALPNRFPFLVQDCDPKIAQARLKVTVGPVPYYNPVDDLDSL